jgi:nucleolar complex protein 3
VLYFSVLKHPGRTPLLPTALEGITQFAHFINVDFFRDLLAVLRRIIFDHPESSTTAPDDEEQPEEDPAALDPVGASVRTRTRLLAIVTAFELLSGQGEAINIDLNDFISALFALLRPLSLDTGLEDPPLVTTATIPTSQLARPLQVGRAPPKQPVAALSTADMLFRCLHAVFFSRHISAANAPPWRAAAFSKRLSECALFLPPLTAKRALTFVRQLMSKDPKLEGMLNTEERRFDGVYKPEMDDPQLCNPFATSLWELQDLSTSHWDGEVRHEAGLLRDGRVV